MLAKKKKKVGSFLNQKVLYLTEKTNITVKLNHQHCPFLFLMLVKLEWLKSTFYDVLSMYFLVMFTGMSIKNNYSTKA